jgi:hypothetical protein
MENKNQIIIVDLKLVDEILLQLYDSRSTYESQLTYDWKDNILEDYLAIAEDYFEINHLIEVLEEKKRICLTTYQNK